MANNGYSAGNLNLSIIASADNTLKYLDAVIERLNFIEKGLGGIKSNSYIRKTTPRQQKSNGNVLGIAKLGVNIYMMRRLGRFMGDLVQVGSDYNETLNLWQVAMRNNLDVADQFVNKMQKAYGISSKTLMNAQAVFKNMIGSLGQISDQTAYALSEALVQMSADYASLYNRTLESAFQNMQSMLAGQVRPIRSAGLDMTETTLFQFYQQLGGTKTMRQLNRTEKQLLSILAVYQQMGSAGALGDMSKTLNQFANQSRMMTEYWAELKTWSGLLLKDLIDQSGMLIYINALLITATEIIKAIAKSRGIGNENFLTGLFETTSATNDEVDELQGKLLDFDKFRSLEGAGGQTDVAIDEKLLQAITGYSSKIDQAQNAAQKLAETWLEVLGFTKGADGQLEITEQNLEKITSKMRNLLGVASAVSGFLFGKTTFKNTWIAGLIGLFAYGYATNDKFKDSIDKIIGSLVNLSVPLLDITINILTPFLQAITPIVEFFADFILFLDELGLLEPLIWGIIAAFIGFKGLQLIDYVGKLYDKFDKWIYKMMFAPDTANKMLKPLEKQKISFGNLAIAIGLAVGSFALFDGIIGGLEGNAKRTVSIIATVVGALVTLLGVILAIKGGVKGGIIGASIAGLGVGALFAGIKGLASKEAQTLNNIPNYEMGASDIDSGTIFRAGEFGKTEAVYTGSNGKTNVANIQQMKTAYRQALNEWWATAKNDIPEFEGASDSGLYTVVEGEARRRGKKFANV